jgi:Bacterial Ig-like domain (group 3)
MNKIKSALTVAALAAAAGGVILAGAGSASAQGTPTPWAPGGVNQDPNAVGGIAFFDASGNQITSGSTTAKPFAAYAVGLTDVAVSGDTSQKKATLFGYLPTTQTPDNWGTNEQLGLSTNYPNSSAPAPVNGTTLPVNTGAATDIALETAANDLGATLTTTGYQNVYQVRLYQSSAANGLGVKYDYADVLINSTTHTWSLVWSPDQAGTSTSSTLGSSSTSVNQGQSVTLTDTITPSGANGSVQFKDNGGNIGSPVTVSGGVATLPYTLTTSGSHPITAVFTPTALSGYASSTSNTVTITAAKVLTNTTTALVVSPNTGPAFSAVTLTATVTPSVAGSVKFFDNGAQIGPVATVASGQAQITYSGFAQGDHANITAMFTPTDTTSYNPSTSAAADFLATAPTGPAPSQSTITANVAAGSLSITTPYTPEHPLDVGTLALNNQGTLLSGSIQFGDGNFVNYGAAGPDGTGSIQVVDTRAGGADWSASALSAGLLGATDSINGQNLGLTGITGHYLSGNALQSGDIVFTDHAAAPGVAPADAGSLGLGGSTAHEIAHTVGGGVGSVAITGLLTVNAPTSTKAGAYTGTITFTVA